MRHPGPVRSRVRVAVLTRELLVVGRNCVAIAAHPRYTSDWVRKPEEGMVENRARPSRSRPGRVTGSARRGIIRRHVIRHVGAISLSVREIRLMAAVAIRGWIARRIVAAHMAVRARIHHRPDRASNGGAGREHMGSLQRKTSRGVIKFSVRPENRVVACRTHRGRKACTNVVRHVSAKGGRAVPGRLVAAVTIRVRRREVVVVVDVAVRAGVHLARRRHLVRTRQRPPGRAVIENGSGPRERVVARRAVGCRKRCSGTRVRRVIGLLPGRKMALRVPAIGRLDRER